MTGEAIELKGVTKTFPGSATPAVAPLDLVLGAGEITVLIGPSGCGKTTTMRMINRLINPTDGVITIGGTDIREQSVTELRRGIGYVIQQIGLFPHRTIAQNIATVPSLLKWPKAKTQDRVEELADLVGIDRVMLGRYPAELSGGQQQRVGVARALAADPPVLLMDEPFGAVDPIVRARLQAELISLQERVHKTIVLVTHDIDEAISLGDKVAVLNVGGIVEQFAAPDELLANPSNEFVADFVGHERSIKRLSLSRVRDLDLQEGPVVGRSATPEEARAVLARTGSEWLGITDDGTFQGWVPASDFHGESVRELDPQVAAAQVRPDATLREALEVILTARSSTAVVLNDDGTYGGTVSLETIREGLGR
ncbi:ATP-binding cassette domain-containing protein [Aquihabitans sp. G128]|uniref:ABC transporter ATP-binding protein n=1 Tax=Aquihabitans sp. G128 TaxID=2849779 RepID=UPI001C21B766|nr:ATP-binding cassette domain-containing protein [Aquihabitans sp. G128]QXC63208.1 ATP-binding cassette domain-containing protein [Aquihabitans sp. G128]